MENSIKIKHSYGGNWRWVFFLGGILFTYAWIVAKVITDESSGLPISDTERLLCIIFFFPLFWGMGFIPHKQVEQLTVDRSGISTLESRSKTIFHRRTYTDLFVPAKDILHVEIAENSEDSTLDVGIWFCQSSRNSGYIALSNYPDIDSATDGAKKAARLLSCEVKAPKITESA